MKARTVKADRLTRRMMLPLIAFFALYLLLTGVTTPLSAAMLLPGALVFLSSYGLFMLAARRRISRFVRMYVNNCFYLNADASSVKAMRVSLVPALCGGAFLLCVSGPFSRLVSDSAKATGAFRISLLFFVLHAVQGALYGYVEGAGKRSFILVTDVLRCLLTVTVPLFAGYTGFLYGKKLDALLMTDDCCAAYCALFVFAALLLVDLVFLLLLLAVRAAERARLKKSKKGKPRYLGDEPAFFKACGQLMAAVVLPCALFAVTCICFDGDTGSVSALSVRFFVIPLLAGIFVSLRFTGACYRLPGLSDEIETGGMSLRFHRLTHRLSIVLPVMTALLAVLASPLSTALYSAAGEDGVMMLFAGAFHSAVFCAFAVFCMLLSLTRRRKQMAYLAVASFLPGIVSSVLLVRFTAVGLKGLLAANIVSLLLFTAGAYVVLTGLIGENRTAFLRMLAKPVPVAGVCALVLYPLQTELTHVIGEAATCVICASFGFALYLALLSFFKGFEWGDLMSLPFGRELVRFSLRKRN